MGTGYEPQENIKSNHFHYYFVSHISKIIASMASENEGLLIICLHAISVDRHIKIFASYPLVQAEEVFDITFKVR